MSDEEMVTCSGDAVCPAASHIHGCPTAVPSGPRDDRAELAAAVFDWLHREYGPYCDVRLSDADEILQIAEPLAEARAVARAQQELRAAADAMRRFVGRDGVPSEVAHAVIVLLVGVEARADALGDQARAENEREGRA